MQTLTLREMNSTQRRAVRFRDCPLCGAKVWGSFDGDQHRASGIRHNSTDCHQRLRILLRKRKKLRVMSIWLNQEYP